ncbi:hypothetical protein PG994_002791 [Apiospora phragmitis]|uniref:Heterokaryon incompatibility domain-containing protein n=1 Tax=Apiospora phragmitis TaxID=2905665 RepID=A0ABR1W658_9PEZI
MSFQYQELATNESLRLLRVDRLDKSKGTLMCTLLHIDRHDPPPGVSWIALSYRWGDEKDLVTLRLREVSDVASGIPPSALEDDYSSTQAPRSALDMTLSLYHSGHISDRWIWIDYICLNQQDQTEKGIQVGLMGSVYSLSAQTIVYTGPASYSTSTAMDFLKGLKAVFEGSPRGDRNVEWKPEMGRLARPPDASMVREAVLPHDVLFVWGQHSLPWAEMEALANWDTRSNLFALLGNATGTWTAISTLKKIMLLRQNRQGSARGYRCGLSFALYTCDAATSFDPRDRIFGLLGLLYGPEAAIDIKPDYSSKTTPAAVFTRATRKYTVQNDSFELVYSAGIGLLRDIEGLPSWVPDYTKSLRQFPGGHLCAGKGDLRSLDLEPLQFQASEFKVQAYLVDTISHVLPYKTLRRPSEYTSMEDDSQVAWYLEHAIRHVSQAYPVPWSEDLPACFVRTLTSNSVVLSGVDGGTPSPPAFDRAFAQLGIARKLGILGSATPRPNQVATAKERQSFLTTVAGYMEDNTICTIPRGRMALVPRHAEPGDVVAVCPGARLPFILRPSRREAAGCQRFQMVGTDTERLFWNS